MAHNVRVLCVRFQNAARTLHLTTNFDMETNVNNTNEPQHYAKLPVVRHASRKCFNCKHASNAFKIAGKTHHQCCHPKHEAGFESGELSAWDTLQEWYNSCESHELRV